MSADKSSPAASSFESSLEVPRAASENESSILNVYKQNLPEIQSSCRDLSFYSAKKKQLTSSYLHTKNSSINSPYSTLTALSPWRSSTPILPQLLKMKLPQPTLSSIGYSNDSPILHYQRNVHFINSEEINLRLQKRRKAILENMPAYIHDFQVTVDCISVPQEIQFTHSYQQPTISTKLEWMLTSNEFDRPHTADSQNTPTDACNNTNNARD
ncbi:Acyl-CoA synthetase [Trichinella spiralis]|uniref:Acyl-CoA synthetase n=1 Tax=Trichinella spiralis TaxID=6334 RepID=A0ABR3KAI6_TRISP